PIFGPIMGALFGPVAFLWIVLGSIFAGAVHDYLTGMISIRNRGAHIPELAGKFLGNVSKHRSEEHTSELQSRFDLVCRLLLEKKKRSASIATLFRRFS